MIKNCEVKVQGGMYGIKVSKSGKGFFNNASAKPKAAVCPGCGYTALYIDEYKSFDK